MPFARICTARFRHGPSLNSATSEQIVSPQETPISTLHLAEACGYVWCGKFVEKSQNPACMSILLLV